MKKATKEKPSAQRTFDAVLFATPEQARRGDFALAALMGGYRSFCQDTTRDIWETYDDFAESCFNMADAMLREEKKRTRK
jgi:hypothetical protein